MKKITVDEYIRDSIQDSVAIAMGFNDGSKVLVKNAAQKNIALEYMKRNPSWEDYDVGIKVDPVAEVGTIEPSAWTKAQRKLEQDKRRKRDHTINSNLLMGKGSIKFGDEWSHVVDTVFSVGQRYVDITDPTNKVMLTDVCYTLLARGYIPSRGAE